ncbi:MAG: cation transporter [Planctomycetes bacterium]|nr:cation transporter [Planctomycetota bacterium]
MSNICLEVKTCSTRLMIFSVIASLVLSVIKGGIGILGKSEALVADGLYSFYQGFICARSLITKRDIEPDKDSNRFPLLTTGQIWFVSSVVGLILILGVFDVFVFSIIRLIKAASGWIVDPSPYAFYVASFSSTVNYIFSCYSNCAVQQTAVKNIAELNHSFRLSVLISMIALVGIGLSRWAWLGGDAFAAMVIVVLIVKPVFGLFQKYQGDRLNTTSMGTNIT